MQFSFIILTFLFFYSLQFGKSLQDDTKNLETELISDLSKLQEATLNPRFLSRQIFAEKLAAVYSRPDTINRMKAFAAGKDLNFLRVHSAILKFSFT